MADATPPTIPPTEPPAVPPAGDSAGLVAKNAELIGREKKANARIKELEAKAAEVETANAKLAKVTELAKALGVDINTTDPEAERKRREADKLAQDARNGKVERAVFQTLLKTKTREIPDEMTEAILAGALSRHSIGIGDDGKVTGLDEYLAPILAQYTVDGEPRKTAPMPPARGGAAGAGAVIDPKFANLKTFNELVALGPTAPAECLEKFPAHYETLRRNQLAGLAHPTRPVFGTKPT